jgi:hypothetical protein
MSKEQLKALDMFVGGEKGIYKRMTKVIRNGLKKKVSEIKNKLKTKKVGEKRVINAIAKELGVKAGTLTRIFYGKSNGEVNYKLFSRLEFPFELSIYDALGKPKELDILEIRNKWLDECKRHRIFRAAAMGKNGPPKDELTLYVTLRAIKELV